MAFLVRTDEWSEGSKDSLDDSLEKCGIEGGYGWTSGEKTFVGVLNGDSDKDIKCLEEAVEKATVAEPGQVKCQPVPKGSDGLEIFIQSKIYPEE